MERSHVLAAAQELVRDGGALVTRCAWCDRYALGGIWLEREETAAFLPRDVARSVTHGICPECIADLRARGLSR